MIEPVWIVGFSGHRPKERPGRTSPELEGCRTKISQALSELKLKAENAGGKLHFYSSAAEGADVIAIESAEELGLAVHVILPLPVEEFAGDFAELPGTWDRTLAAIAKSGAINDCGSERIRKLCDLGTRPYEKGVWPPDAISGWSYRVVASSGKRDESYYECGERMLEGSDALIAVFTDSDGEIGGTSDVIEIARSMNLPICLIDPRQEHIVWNDSQLDCEADAVIEELTEIRNKSKAANRFVPGEGVSSQTLLDQLDGISLESGNRFRRWVELAVLLHFFAAAIATTNAAFFMGHHDVEHPTVLLALKTVTWSKILTSTEFLLVSMALLIMFGAHRLKLHQRWLLSRFASEILRGQILTRRVLDPIYPLIGRHHPRWRRFALSCELPSDINSADHELDWKMFKSNYLDKRIRDQILHFSSAINPAVRRSNLCKYISLAAGYLAPPIILLALVGKLNGSAWIHGVFLGPLVLVFLPIILPLTAGVAISLGGITDSTRRTERYRILVDRLEVVASRFPTLKTPSTIRRAVAKTEDMLLDELVEWYSANRQMSH